MSFSLSSKIAITRFAITPKKSHVAWPILPVLVLVAALTGCSDDGGDSALSLKTANAEMKKVSVDTFFYAGTTEPVSFVKTVDMMSDSLQITAHQISEDAMKMQQRAQGPDVSPSLKKAAVAYANFADAFKDFIEDPKGTFANYGVDGDAVDWSFHLEGFAPVFRVALDDNDKFIEAIVAYENEHGLNPDVKSFDDNEVRIYTFEPEDGTPTTIGLTVLDDTATLVISPMGETGIQETLELAGSHTVSPSSGVVEDVQRKYKYTSDFVGFLDFRYLVGMLTDVENDSRKRFQSTLSEEQTSMLNSLQTPQCKTELTRLAEIWPRMVMGYKDFGVVDDKFSATGHFALEVNHPEISGALGKIRGHIPQNLKGSDSAFSFGLGVDVGQLGGALGQITTLLSGLNYQCGALAQLNKLAAGQFQAALMGVYAFSGMAQGVRGIGMSLFDVNEEAFDGMITIPAENPQGVLMMAKMLPPLSNVNVPADGSAVNIGAQIAAQTGLAQSRDMNVAARGQQVVLFAGENGSKLAAQPAEAVGANNGFLYVSFDINGLTEMVDSSSGMISQDNDEVMDVFTEQVQKMEDAFSDGRFGYAIDFTDKGVEFESVVKFKASKP